MSILSIDVRLSGIETLSRSQVNRVMKRAYYEMGSYWRKHFLPLHFGERATQRYGYTLRSGARNARLPRLGKRLNSTYSARKYRFVGHTRPLEFTGEGKRKALYEKRISATSKKVVVRLPLKFNLRNPHSQVHMADEIRAVRRDELGEMSAFFVKLLRTLLREQSPGARVSGTIKTYEEI